MVTESAKESRLKPKSNHFLLSTYELTFHLLTFHLQPMHKISKTCSQVYEFFRQNVCILHRW